MGTEWTMEEIIRVAGGFPDHGGVTGRAELENPPRHVEETNGLIATSALRLVVAVGHMALEIKWPEVEAIVATSELDAEGEMHVSLGVQWSSGSRLRRNKKQWRWTGQITGALFTSDLIDDIRKRAPQVTVTINGLVS